MDKVHGPLFILFHLHFMYVTSQKWLILIKVLFFQKVSEP